MNSVEDRCFGDCTGNGSRGKVRSIKSKRRTIEAREQATFVCLLSLRPKAGGRDTIRCFDDAMIDGRRSMMLVGNWWSCAWWRSWSLARREMRKCVHGAVGDGKVPVRSSVLCGKLDPQRSCAAIAIEDGQVLCHHMMVRSVRGLSATQGWGGNRGTESRRPDDDDDDERTRNEETVGSHKNTTLRKKVTSR
jgi:hypothetical protein